MKNANKIKLDIFLLIVLLLCQLFFVYKLGEMNGFQEAIDLIESEEWQ